MGQSLDKYIDNLDKTDDDYREKAWSIAIDICESIQAVHNSSRYHNDLLISDFEVEESENKPVKINVSVNKNSKRFYAGNVVISDLAKQSEYVSLGLALATLTGLSKEQLENLANIAGRNNSANNVGLDEFPKYDSRALDEPLLSVVRALIAIDTVALTSLDGLIAYLKNGKDKIAVGGDPVNFPNDLKPKNNNYTPQANNSNKRKSIQHVRRASQNIGTGIKNMFGKK